MTSGFSVESAVFPLTLTIERMAVVFKPGVVEPEEWDTPVWYGFSEVDLGPEPDPEATTPTSHHNPNPNSDWRI